MNPFYTLLPTDKPALSDIYETITYKDLIKEAIEIRDWFNTLGYGHGHRIGVAGDNSVRTYKYILAAQMAASCIGLRIDNKQNDWNYKIPAANLNVVIELKDLDEIIHHKHYDRSIECDKEYSVYFSSGTTSNRWGAPQSTPMVWDVDDYNWGMGIDIVNYNRAVINPYYREFDDNIQIQPMQPWIGWGQESTTLNLIKQGHTILLEDRSTWDVLVKRFKPTWTVMFPLVALKLMEVNDGLHNPEIKCVEMSGARVPKKQLEDMKKFFNCNYFVSHYCTSQSGNFFHNWGDGSNLDNIGKPCEGFVHAYGEDFVRIGKNNTLELKWHGSPPHYCNDDGYYDTGDIVKKLDDGNYEFLGRSNEMLMIRGGSKLQAPSIEDRLYENPKIKEIYVYPIPESELRDIGITREEIDSGTLYQVPGCLYYGDISVEEVKDYCNEKLPEWMRPANIFKLKNKLSTFTDDNVWKVRRLSMHDTLKEKHNEWCESSYY